MWGRFVRRSSAGPVGLCMGAAGFVLGWVGHALSSRADHGGVGPASHGVVSRLMPRLSRGLEAAAAVPVSATSSSSSSSSYSSSSSSAHAAASTQLAQNSQVEGSSSTVPAACVLDFLLLAGQLKDVKRAGWVPFQVSDPESVAAHSWRMSLMCLVLGSLSSSVDVARAVKIAVVHDVAEALVGDILPTKFSGISKADKSAMEAQAMRTLQESLAAHESTSPVAAEVFALWQEYETAHTPEARLVKDVDKLEMLLQAYEYERAHRTPKSLSQFYGASQQIQTALGAELSAEIIRRRQELLTSPPRVTPS
eukprot:g54768.t1